MITFYLLYNTFPYNKAETKTESERLRTNLHLTSLASLQGKSLALHSWYISHLLPTILNISYPIHTIKLCRN